MSETIVTGKKYRILTDVAQKVWQRVSFWTKSSDVEFNDGKTAETKVGAISGITDSLVSTSSNIAASAKAVSELNGNLNSINGNLSSCVFTTEGSGANTKYYIQSGADSASKKELGIEPLTLRIQLQGSNVQSKYSYIPTYNKNILITRWGSGGSNLDKLAFYSSSGFSNIGSQIPFSDAGDTLNCKDYKYIAVAAPIGNNQTYNIQFDYY